MQGGRADWERRISPVFLVFLTGVHALHTHFSAEFEFTSEYLTLLAQSAYAGVFGA
jgi:hypothetical protein